MYTYVAQHPVQQFLDAWDELDMGERIASLYQGSGPGPMTLQTFFEKETTTALRLRAINKVGILGVWKRARMPVCVYIYIYLSICICPS